MKSIEILAIAARYYNILSILRNRNASYSDIAREMDKTVSSISSFIEKKMTPAGLVEVKKEKNERIVRITDLGDLTLSYLKKYDRMLNKPKLDEELVNNIKYIVKCIELNIRAPMVEDLFAKKLSETVRTYPDAVFCPELQEFFEQYLIKSVSIFEINETLYRCIGPIISNIELKKWFYNRIYKILVDQFAQTQLNDEIRDMRVRFLWRIYELDEDLRDEILNLFVSFIEDKCSNLENEVCKYICSSYPQTIQEDLIKRLLELKGKEHFLNKFFPPLI